MNRVTSSMTGSRQNVKSTATITRSNKSGAPTAVRPLIAVTPHLHRACAAARAHFRVGTSRWRSAQEEVFPAPHFRTGIASRATTILFSSPSRRTI
ncbi:hypothetical protein HNQ60_002906 [Povalibacter uvarum]|uniref:Uncharacterized protein n=1 Tax=Povalibacter uvarum TaxID=732238 RepID=A0A841HQ45_9GAMM|nr:hypothetical protein [Povalibacter uvarum]